MSAYPGISKFMERRHLAGTSCFIIVAKMVVIRQVAAIASKFEHTMSNTQYPIRRSGKFLFFDFIIGNSVLDIGYSVANIASLI